MRLLNTATFTLKEFLADVPKYAILSHTWGDDEISLQDIQRDHAWYVGATSGIAFRRFAKVRDSCEKAASHGYGYIWIDTCCIDKTSSSELSEAINSMYRWYQKANVCYAYLADVDTLQGTHDSHASFRKSRWFTRGWTLQELIAPLELCFYDRNWVFIGTKSTLLQEVSAIAGIELYALQGGDLQRLTVGRRMSWMADRQTTRTEDMAYCLLGIFAISMPMLYGEGDGAFIRLQEEIMKCTDDQSLFAWGPHPGSSSATGFHSLFATSPAHVRWPKSIAQFRFQRSSRPSSASTNKGLQLQTILCQSGEFGDRNSYIAVLDCPIGVLPGVLAGINVTRLSAGDRKSSHFARIGDTLLTIQSSRTSYEGFSPDEEQDELLVDEYIHRPQSLGVLYSTWKLETLYIGSVIDEQMIPGFWLVAVSPLKLSVGPVYPPHVWDADTWTLQPPSRSNHFAAALFVEPFLEFSTMSPYATVEGLILFLTVGRFPGCVIAPGNEQDLPYSRELLACTQLRDHAGSSDHSTSPPYYFYDEKYHVHCISSHKEITCVIEPKPISGREMSLVRVFHSGYPPTDLKNKRFHFNDNKFLKVNQTPFKLHLNYDCHGHLVQATDGTWEPMD